ncbi:MAG: phosphoribosylanthranilate isomerase [Bariatricus sp.]
MVKVKVCGLRREEDIAMANAFRPDFVGFVFADSRRKVDEETAKMLRMKLREDISAVGVFVNEKRENIYSLCKQGIIQMVQLHGDEDEAYIKELKNYLPEIPVIKAVRVRSKEQILEAEKSGCDYLLLDTYVKEMYGGSGKAFDKSIIPELEKPYFLAGGLNASNVMDNIRACHPYAVDVSSAVETDGWKDAGKIKDFLERIREHE